MSNATYLFEKPQRSFHNSESFWTSLFALYLMEISRKSDNQNLPVFELSKGDTDSNFNRNDEDWTVPGGLCFKNIVVEGRLTKESFENLEKPFPNDLANLKPDIIVQSENKNVVIIEVKTIGHELTKYQKEIYIQIKDFLAENGYNVKLFFLISEGYEGNLNVLEYQTPDTNQYKILLWEHIFKHIFTYNSKSLIAHYLGDIEEYYQLPTD